MITIVQSRISSELAIPMESATLLGLLENRNQSSAFIDWNFQGAKLPEHNELVYLSLYTVVPFRFDQDVPLALRTLSELKSAGAKKIVVGFPHAAPIDPQIFINAGAMEVFCGDTISYFQKYLGIQIGSNVIPSFSQLPLNKYRRSILSHGKVSLPLVLSPGSENLSSDDMKTLISKMVTTYGANHFMVEDILFNSSVKKVEEFCDLMGSHFKGITWECLNGLHPANLTDKIVIKMKNAGCVHMALSLECLDQAFLSSKNHNYDVKSALRLIKTSSETGMFVSGYFLWEYLKSSPAGFWPQIRMIRESAITLPHIYSLNTLTQKERMERAVVLIYLYLVPKRLRALYKLKIFSPEYLSRSVKKLVSA